MTPRQAHQQRVRERRAAARAAVAAERAELKRRAAERAEFRARMRLVRSHYFRALYDLTEAERVVDIVARKYPAWARWLVERAHGLPHLRTVRDQWQRELDAMLALANEKLFEVAS